MLRSNWIAVSGETRGDDGSRVQVCRGEGGGESLRVEGTVEVRDLAGMERVVGGNGAPRDECARDHSQGRVGASEATDG